MNQIIRELRLPSISALALFAATVVAEVPVILMRMLLALPVLVILLLLKGDGPGGAEGLIELALIPTGWALLALITPFGGGWWWAQNMGGPRSLRARAHRLQGCCRVTPGPCFTASAAPKSLVRHR
jgi:hypothetical protein